MDQENWKFVMDYLSAKEHASGDVQKIEQEEKKIQEWLRKDPGHQKELDQALWLWKHTATLPENDEWKESFNVIQASLLQEAPQKTLQETPQKTLQETPQKTINFKIWLAVAAIFTAVALFTLFYKIQQPVLQQTSMAWITKSASSGKMINVMLPDGTQIWLNSGSSISYPENLRHADLRTVKLKGEAFFKVKRDVKHPFIVHSLNIQTRVLGTSFNIRAWQGQQTEVTVLTGKVAVSRDSAGTQSAAIHLLPNQKAAGNSAKLHLENVEDARTAIGWTEGKMVFDQLPVKEVFETLERRYAVKIIADQSFKGCKLTAKFNNVSLNEVLQTLQMTLDIHYTINKHTIYIKGGKCN